MTPSEEAQNGLVLIRLSLNRRGHPVSTGGHDRLLQLGTPIQDAVEVLLVETQAAQLRSPPERHRWIRPLRQVSCKSTPS